MGKREDFYAEFSGYIRQGEPTRAEKAKYWEAAIGLQEVDGLKPSKYLIELAKEHIEGKIDTEEVKKRIEEYHSAKNSRKNYEKECKEADLVSSRIERIIGEQTVNIRPLELNSIHKRLFEDVFDGAGVYRDYNITKNEWVLDGDTVDYIPYQLIKECIQYDFEQERNFSYQDLNIDNAIKHICRFAANIWQIHPFCEGNTRTVTVFIIKYLKFILYNLL